jgi:hypothetical protein
MEWMASQPMELTKSATTEVTEERLHQKPADDPLSDRHTVRVRTSVSAVRADEVHFVARHLLRDWADIAELEEQDVDRQAGRFRGGPNNWIIQTYLRLKGPLETKGISVSISEDLKPAAVNIAHRDSLNRWLLPYCQCFIVGVRADRPKVFVCDWEIVQNQSLPRSAEQSAIPVWPQPGLIARDPGRGARIERMAYFGRTGTASAWLAEPGFQAALAQLGVQFEIREDAWFDYSDVDLVLAHRMESPTMLQQKPASKLINAWHAGTPALLGDEPAYRALRRSDLDYIAVDSAQEVLSAVRRLRADPLLFHGMVHNGAVRAADFTVDQVRELWLDCLLGHALPKASQVALRPAVMAWSAQARRLVLQKIESRRFKYRHARERAALQKMNRLAPKL